MFDLFRSRDRMVRFMLSALLLMVALSMVTYLVPSYGGGDRGGDSVIAQIGKDTVTMREAQQAIQNLMRRQRVPPNLISIYAPRIIDQMITERTLMYEAGRLGLKVSDEDMFNAIRLTVPQLFQDGKFVGREVYAAVLAQQEMTIPEFESEVARELIVTRLKQMVLAGTVVTPAEIEQEFRKRNEKVEIEYVKLARDKLKSEVQISPAEMKEFFDKNRVTFTIPEKRNLAILLIDQAKLEQAINPKEAELRRAYESDKDRFRTPERVQARHILLKTTGKPASEEPKIKAKIEELLKQIKGGADFAELARKNSEDQGSATKGGDLGWIVRGQTVKPFEDAAFSLKPKEISNVVKTEYGFHIIQVLEHQQAQLRPFDDVKTQLTEEYRKQRAGQMVQDLADRAEAALKKDPPEKVAKDLNLPVPIIAENVGPGETISAIGPSPDFQQSLAGLKRGDVSQPVSLPPNRVAMAVVTAVIPAHPPALEEVQARVRQSLEGQRVNELISKRASELVAKANAMNGDLEKAAKALGLEVKKPPAFNRQGAVEGLGQAAYVGDAFTKPAGSILGPVPVPDGRVIAKVMAHVPPDLSQLAAQRSGLRDEIKSNKARSREDLFEAGLKERLTKEGKVKIHQDVVNRLVASYRG
jgi:peptidyl-prolyl cis-trans isomerase D